MIKFSTKYFLVFFIVCLVSLQNYAQSVGGTISGASTFCSCNNGGFVTLTLYVGTILDWESSIDGGVSWNSTSNTFSQQSYTNLCQTTCYRAIVQLAGFPPDTSTVACNTVFQPSDGGTISGGGTFCAGSGNGTLTLSGNTGNPLFWESSIDNGSTWTNIANTTTTLNYTNISQNTIYHAVVQNGGSCPSDTSAQALFIIDSLSNAGNVSGNDTVCYGANSGVINVSGITGSITEWISSTNNGISWTSIPNTTSTLNYLNLIQQTDYKVIVKNNSCPADTSTSIAINVFTPFPVFAGNDTTINEGQLVNLNGTGTGTPLWFPATGLDSTITFNPTATLSNTTTYTLIVTDTNGCKNADNIIITVIPSDFNGTISNLFTPNGDGINDTWFIENIQNFKDNEVFVYNIYGNIVYEKKNYMNDWQGTYNGAELPDGTYFYILKIVDPEKVVKGSIDILRHK